MNAGAVGCHEGIDSGLLESSKVVVRDRSGNVVRLGIENFVPDGVELISCVVVGNREGVSSFISLRILVVEARSSVERLMEIPDVMDEEAKRIRTSSVIVTGVKSVLNVVVDVRLLVPSSVLTGEPVGNVVDSNHDVVGWNHIRARIVGSGFTSLIDKGVVNEVEISLPH